MSTYSKSSIFDLRSNAYQIFRMHQYRDWHTRCDILHLLELINKVTVSDDALAQRVYLTKYPVMDPDTLTEEDMARFSKVNLKNIRSLYANTMLCTFEKLLKYFSALAETDFRFVIPCKLEMKFREYLNIIARYNAEHASEAFENFAVTLKCRMVTDDYMFIDKADMNVLLNRFTELIGILNNKVKDPVNNVYSFETLKNIICKRLEVLCYMSIPVEYQFDIHPIEEAKQRFKLELSNPVFKLLNTASVDTRFSLHHTFMMDNLIDLPRVGYTEDAALFSVLKSVIDTNITEQIGGSNDAGKPDTCSAK